MEDKANEEELTATVHQAEEPIIRDFDMVELLSLVVDDLWHTVDEIKEKVENVKN